MISKAEILSKLSNGELTSDEIISNGWLCSVTQRIRKIKQPRGGYLNPRQFEITQLSGGDINDLYPQENVTPGLVGIAVDYLTRYLSGTDPEKAFIISGLGAHLVAEDKLYDTLLQQLDGLSDNSIRAGVKLAGFDSAFRAGIPTYRPVENIIADSSTISNIRTMVERSLLFFKQYGPVTMDGLTFEGGYTGYVSSGDGDFLTKDTLWDFKVSKAKMKSQQTLQLLMYWRMGLHSIHPEYSDIRFLGIYNPRMNVVYRLDTSKIPSTTISEVETHVIGY